MQINLTQCTRWESKDLLEEVQPKILAISSHSKLSYNEDGSKDSKDSTGVAIVIVLIQKSP